MSRQTTTDDGASSLASPSSDENANIHPPTSPLLTEEEHGHDNNMTPSQAWNLYTSHFLSTWNVRTYEFAAIVFTAKAYPDTLSASAVRGIIRTLASIALSSTVGRWVDHTPDRLRTLLTTITINRISVLASSPLWYIILSPYSSPSASSTPLHPSLPQFHLPPHLPKNTLFALILFFGILENLSASGNMLSMERDWVVTAASPAGQAYDLTHMNAVMRRIDLVCKLIAPILISLIISAMGTRVGVMVVGGMSAFSWGVEIWCARRVWRRNEKLRGLKHHTLEVDDEEIQGVLGKMREGLRRYTADLKSYLKSPVMIPSLSLSLLHLSALSYGGTFITFLLSAGFSLDLITIARAVGSVVEISSTVVTPVGVRVLGKAHLTHGRFRGMERRRRASGTDAALLGGDDDEAEERVETGLERLGLWGVTFQLLNLVPVVLVLWTLIPTTTPSPLRLLLPHSVTAKTASPTSSNSLPPSILPTLLLFTTLSTSRLGLWIFDLTTQQLTQTLTPPSSRSSFAGVENSFVGVFELLQHLATIVLHRPEMFKWLAVGSWAAVALSAACYAGWVRSVRGHLVHWERWGCGKGES